MSNTIGPNFANSLGGLTGTASTPPPPSTPAPPATASGSPSSSDGFSGSPELDEEGGSGSGQQFAVNTPSSLTGGIKTPIFQLDGKGNKILDESTGRFKPNPALS